jgi:HEPN domain-containing protein
MDMIRLGSDYLRGARSRLVDAESALRRGDYPEVVRYSQEAVELSLKACLRMAGIEYPKVHDVGDELRFNALKFPAWFSKRIEEFARISAELAIKRAASMYGIEAAGKGPSDLFDKEEAELSIREAKLVYENADRLYNEYKKQ